jgi:hypothetical protein
MGYDHVWRTAKSAVQAAGTAGVDARDQRRWWTSRFRQVEVFVKYNKLSQMKEQQIRRQEADRRDHRISRTASHLKPLKYSDELMIRRSDIEAFAAIALAADHIICVRATNRNALAYIGRRGYAPKPIDCKPKTSDYDIYLTSTGTQLKCGGLVVDPTRLTGRVYASDEKQHKAKREWAKFATSRLELDTEQPIFLRTGGGFFAVDIDKRSKHYGCLMLSEQNLPDRRFHTAVEGYRDFVRKHMSYIHSDYDLYGLIDVAKVEQAIRRGGKLEVIYDEIKRNVVRGQKHFYTDDWKRIRNMLNPAIGCNMIQHGPQDDASHDTTDMYVFYPDGGKYYLDGSANVDVIRDVYELLFHKGAPYRAGA